MSSHPVESLSALLDDELDDAERRAVEAHLAACPACARHLRELTAVDALARGLPPAAAPEGYLEALPGRVRQRLRTDRPLFAGATWAWPLAAGLALAVLAPIVLREGPVPIPPADDRAAAQAVIPPAAPKAPPVVREEEVRPTVSGDFASETDTRPRARARQDSPRRAAPADAPAAPPPPAAQSRAAPDKQSADTIVLRDDALADEPAFAPAPPAAAGEAKRAEAEARVQAGERAAGSMASVLRKNERENASAEAADESAFRTIAALPLSTAREARRARQAWLRFLAAHPRGERVDEARVRIVEASVAAFRARGDAADRTAAEQDAAAYLSSPNAPQAARVQSALRRLDDPR